MPQPYGGSPNCLADSYGQGVRERRPGRPLAPAAGGPDLLAVQRSIDLERAMGTPCRMAAHRSARPPPLA
jgi:hypothetical protein